MAFPFRKEHKDSICFIDNLEYKVLNLKIGLFFLAIFPAKLGLLRNSRGLQGRSKNPEQNYRQVRRIRQRRPIYRGKWDWEGCSNQKVRCGQL